MKKKEKLKKSCKIESYTGDDVIANPSNPASRLSPTKRAFGSETWIDSYNDASRYLSGSGQWIWPSKDVAFMANISDGIWGAFYWMYV